MSVFQIGSIIRKRREEMGLSQEDLADGICAVPTLSRIENNERQPTKNHFEMLMQRLGYSITSLDYFADKKEFLAHELKIRLRYAYISKDLEAARKYLQEFEGVVENPTKIDEQFLILYRTLLSQEQLPEDEMLQKFDDALRLTCPKYEENRIPHVLSYEEIILLNNIAVRYERTGKIERAIAILYTLKEYYEHRVVSTDEALRTQPMVLYNLSKLLGMSGRYDECIAICDLGIRIARTSSRCNALGETLFNRGWALIQRNLPGDIEAAKLSIKQAYWFASAMGQMDEVRIFLDFYEKSFSEKILA